jgi:HEAT repeat protein
LKPIIGVSIREKNKYDPVAIEAAINLVKKKDGCATQIIELLGNQDPMITNVTVFIIPEAMKYKKDTRLRLPLVKALARNVSKSEDALRSQLTDQDLDWVRKLIKYPSVQVQKFAIEYLGRNGNKKDIKLLIAAIAKHGDFAWSCASELLDSKDEARVIAFLFHNNKNIRIFAAEWLSKNATSRSKKALEKALSDPEFFVRVYAEDALSRLKDDAKTKKSSHN